MPEVTSVSSQDTPPESAEPLEEDSPPKVVGGVHYSVPEALSEKFAERLRHVVAAAKESRALLPVGAEVVFHNTERQFDWGGWLPPSRLTRSQHASLFYDFGAINGNPDYSFQVQIDLTTRQKVRNRIGIRVQEPLESFVERALELGHKRVNDARYLKNYRFEDRVEYSIRRAYCLCKERGIDGVEDGAVQSPFNNYTREPSIGILFVQSGEVELVSELLSQWLCNIDCDLLSEEERREPLPKGMYYGVPASTERGKLLWFDDVPILIVPRADRAKCFSRTEPSVWRTPLLYNLRDVRILPESLKQLMEPPKALPGPTSA